MLCGNCRKNQATKTYEMIKNGNRETAYYCLDCYHKLFVCTEDTASKEPAYCSYCGLLASELKRRKTVGCAYCYQTLQHVVLPVVTSMQGEQTHKGKKPYETPSERIMRRRAELRYLQTKFQKEKNYERVRSCEEALLQLAQGLEEDYVWQKRHRLSKR